MRFIRPLKDFIEFKKIPAPCLYLATGEFGLWKDCHEVIQFIADNKWDSYIMLTGFFYLPDLAKLNRDWMSTRLNISLDAGTEETFFAISGLSP